MAVRVDLDRHRCDGHGICAEVAPDVYQLDDEGELIYRFEGQELPEEYQDAALAGAGVCPVAALKRAG
jgi:ferredoxin